MALSLTWGDEHINAVADVLRNKVHHISTSTMVMTRNFIDSVKAGGDLRKEYLNVVNQILSIPADLIYFIRTLTQAHIALSYKIVPEFRHVVQFYSTIVRAARSTM